MLTIFGKKQRYCDGLSRRNFLKVGALAAGSLPLAGLLRAEAHAGASASKKSIINIYLGGGPSHMDMFDLKPTAPVEFRGLFNPIATNVPGMEICEHMPRLAQQGDKIALIRSITGIRDEHSPRQSDTGWSESSMRNEGGRPGLGAVVSKMHGSINGSALTSVALSDFTTAGFLGPVYKDYRPDGPGRSNLRLEGQMNEQRLYDRKALLSSLDRLRRDTDRSGMMTALDDFSQRAIEVVTSGKLAQALDTSKEDAKIRELYGLTVRKDEYQGNNNFLLARRLVESGARVVSLSWGGWDTHSDNFNSLKRQLPALDHGLSGLITDLDQRGLLQDTLIMMSGEFGRTPRINGTAGRDHWAPASFFFLAGGGLRTGQVIGSTNRLGERAQDRPVHFQEVFATVYHQLGIDPGTTTLVDPNGRPQYLIEQRTPIRELI
jgi:hypothetical protein